MCQHEHKNIGSENDKAEISIDNTGYGNNNLTNATWYYFDETESKVGNYWHYENGEIVVQTAG